MCTEWYNIYFNTKYLRITNVPNTRHFFLHASSRYWSVLPCVSVRWVLFSRADCRARHVTTSLSQSIILSRHKQHVPRPAFAHSHYGRRRESKNPGGIHPGSTWRALCIRAWNCKASVRWEIGKPWSSTSHCCGDDFNAFHSDGHKLRDVCSSQIRVSNFLILISTL